MTRRLALLLLLLALLLPYFHAYSTDLYVQPTSISIDAWSDEGLRAFQVNVTAIGGDTNITMRCLGDYVSPDQQNASLSAGEQGTFSFTVNITKMVEDGVSAHDTACYINSTRIDVSVRIKQAPEPGQLSLSSSALTFTVPPDTVAEFPTKLYLTNGYDYAVKVEKALSPAWIDFDPLSLLPGETKPLPLRIDTHGLLAGASYGGIVRFSYNVANHSTFSDTFQVTLYVNGTSEGQKTYCLVLSVLDSSSAEPVPQATIVLDWDAGTQSLTRVTNQTGQAVFCNLLPATYHYTIMKAGYQPIEGSVVVNMDRSKVVVIAPALGNGTNQTTVNLTQTAVNNQEGEGNERPKAGELFIPAYSVNMTVEAGSHVQASLPISARNGYVNMSLEPVLSIPEWITGKLSTSYLFTGQTGFIVFEASPENTTMPGNYSKQFYLAYNDQVAVVTANVVVIKPKQLNRTGGGNLALLAVNPNGTVIDGQANKVYRPASLQVPLVSVLLRGNEGVTAEKPIQVVQNELVYVIVQGDPNHVKVIPKGLALLGAEPRADGILYRYQVKENGAQLDIRLIYYSPLTGEESYERPEEFGYGIYRFEITESEAQMSVKNALLKVRVKDNIAQTDTGATLTLEGVILWPNGTKSNYMGDIAFNCKFLYFNKTFQPVADFTAGEATIQFRYAASQCIPQKPKWWSGDFDAKPNQIIVEPMKVTLNFPKKLRDDMKAEYDLSELDMDIYKVEITPRTHYEIRGTKLIFEPHASTSYTIRIYGHTRASKNGLPKNVDAVVELVTDVVEASSTTTMMSYATWAGIGIGGFLVARMLLPAIETRRKKAKKWWKK